MMCCRSAGELVRSRCKWLGDGCDCDASPSRTHRFTRLINALFPSFPPPLPPPIITCFSHTNSYTRATTALVSRIPPPRIHLIYASALLLFPLLTPSSACSSRIPPSGPQVRTPTGWCLHPSHEPLPLVLLPSCFPKPPQLCTTPTCPHGSLPLLWLCTAQLTQALPAPSPSHLPPNPSLPRLPAQTRLCTSSHTKFLLHRLPRPRHERSLHPYSSPLAAADVAEVHERLQAKMARLLGVPWLAGFEEGCAREPSLKRTLALRAILVHKQVFLELAAVCTTLYPFPHHTMLEFTS
ncbi:unnamed protein product [Closterium sp. Naga37s-1]|nr:unnamed protein product [Closterium sp. Naga37s-1]